MIETCTVPAGIYPIGDDMLPFARPVHEVALNTFAIGQMAVTHEQFAEFVAAGGYHTKNVWTEMGWHWLRSKDEDHPAFWEDARFNHSLQPVVGVCWYEALAFARWLALESKIAWRLPTEAEWEAAARGPQSASPMIEPQQINSVERDIGRPWSALGNGGQGWCGAYDMLGNVWEWCSTRWGRNWQTLDYAYPYQADDGREDLDGSHARVMRGGSWFDPLPQPATRGRYLPGSRGSNIGFRLADDL